jgi:CDP-diacylglycerol--serine O-phosphatidyltransferase
MAEPNRPHRSTRPRRRRPGRKQRQFRRRLRAYRQGRPRRRVPRAAVPSFFTLMNLFSGFLAIIQVFEGNVTYACWLIVLAGFFDVLDGMMARLTNGQSLFGVELDSLADVVSFGVAPSFLVYVFGLSDFGTLGLLIASLPAVCGAVRLARFNVNFDGEKKDYFEGLPIPGQAMAMVAVVMNYETIAALTSPQTNDLTPLVPIVFVLSGLMITNIDFDAVPKPTASYFRTHPIKATAFIMALIITLIWIPEGLLLSLAAYLLLGIGRSIYRVGREIWETPVEDEEARRAEDTVVPEEAAS